MSQFPDAPAPNTASELGKRKQPDFELSDDGGGGDDDEEVLRDLLEELTFAARHIPWAARIQDAEAENEIKEACERYNEFLIETVTKHPALADTFIDPLEDREVPSLLFTVLTQLDREWSHPAIMFLIEKNPSSLLWWHRNLRQEYALLHFINHHDYHHVLMPWIAKEYPWVLDVFGTDEDGTLDPTLVDGFVGAGKVNESVLRSFLEVRPRHIFYQGKRNEDGVLLNAEYILLYRILDGHSTKESTVDFVKWIVAQNPCAMRLRGTDDRSLLHQALLGLTVYKTDNRAEICKFIIETSPDLVQEKGLFEVFSIKNFGATGFFSRVEKDVVTRLLEVRSDLFDLDVEVEEPRERFIGFRNTRNNFLKRLNSLLDEQKDIKEDASLSLQHAKSLIEATSCSKKRLLSDVSSVFHSWSVLFAQQREGKIDEIQIEINQLWTEFEKQYHALQV